MGYETEVKNSNAKFLCFTMDLNLQCYLYAYNAPCSLRENVFLSFIPA